MHCYGADDCLGRPQARTARGFCFAWRRHYDRLLAQGFGRNRPGPRRANFTVCARLVGLHLPRERHEEIRPLRPGLDPGCACVRPDHPNPVVAGHSLANRDGLTAFYAADHRDTGPRHRRAGGRSRHPGKPARIRALPHGVGPRRREPRADAKRRRPVPEGIGGAAASPVRRAERAGNVPASSARGYIRSTTACPKPEQDTWMAPSSKRAKS